MGWLISTNPNFGRKEQVAELLDQFRQGRRNYPSLVDHSQKGNTLYALVHIPTWRVNGVKVWSPVSELAGLTFDLRGNYRVILVFLLQGPKRGEGGGWGYKSMDESMGPAVKDCPERLLKQSQVHDRYEWRVACREARRQANLRKEWAKGLKAGDTIEYKRGPWVKNDETGEFELKTESIKFEQNWSKTFFIGHSEQGRFRYRWDMIEMPKEAS